MAPYQIDNIPNTEVRESTIHGRGLFATDRFASGAVLAALDGQFVPWDEYRASSSMEDEWNAVDGGVLLRTFRTKYFFINHSTRPNLKIESNPLRVVAREDIGGDTELTLDYREEPLPQEYLDGQTYL